jgi:hypothetical protein
LLDVSRVLTLAGAGAPVAIGSVLSVGPEIPLADRGLGVSGWRSPGRPRGIHTFTKDETERTRELYAAFTRLDAKTRTHLRIPLDRLNRAKDRSSPTNSAIELGISLEALFLNDLESDRGELTIRLRIRAARFLGKDASERREIAELVRQLYSVRSIAVHTGKIDERKRGKFATTADLLNAGYGLTGRALTKIIEDGREIGWELVEFA